METSSDSIMSSMIHNNASFHMTSFNVTCSYINSFIGTHHFIIFYTLSMGAPESLTRRASIGVILRASQ